MNTSPNQNVGLVMPWNDILVNTNGILPKLFLAQTKPTWFYGERAILYCTSAMSTPHSVRTWYWRTFEIGILRSYMYLNQHQRNVFRVIYFFSLSAHITQYRSGTVNSNTVNSKFHLIRSYCEIFFYNFPNIPCLKYTVNSNFHLIRSKTLPTNDFELTVPDL